MQIKKTEFDALNAEIVSLKADNEQLTTDLYNRQSSDNLSHEGKRKAEAIMEEMHQMFDGMDNCPRQVDDTREYYGGQKVTLTLAARFARYLINSQR
jgi:hypothetical protein